jgi:hypothetical protein
MEAILHQCVVAGVQRGKIGFKPRAGGGVLFDADPVFQFDDLRVHRRYFSPRGFK